MEIPCRQQYVQNYRFHRSIADMKWGVDVPRCEKKSRILIVFLFLELRNSSNWKSFFQWVFRWRLWLFQSKRLTTCRHSLVKQEQSEIDRKDIKWNSDIWRWRENSNFWFVRCCFGLANLWIKVFFTFFKIEEMSIFWCIVVCERKTKS